MDVERFVTPRSSVSSGRPQVPPKPKDKITDWQKKAEKSLVLSNQYSALSDDEMDSSSVLSVLTEPKLQSLSLIHI